MPRPSPPRRLLAILATTAVAATLGLVPLPHPGALPSASADDQAPTNDAGRRHGRVTLEHQNGKDHVQAAYRDGLLHGTYREFNEEGQLILQASFRDGRLHGRFERRTDAGERLEIARYQDDQREGTRQVFRDGRVVLTETYEDGQRTAQEGDASADPGPPVFAIGTEGLADQTPQGDPDGGPAEAGPDPAAPVGERPAHQQDTSRKPPGYPYSIDEITRAFGRIDELRIEGDPDEQQAAAIRRLIKYRLVCGLTDPIIAFDAEEAILAQRAAEVCNALGRMDHHPPNPGLAEEVYRDGEEGAGRSNLIGPGDLDPVTSMECWMVDNGSNNRDEVGHRRWCLDPGLYETAYGSHERFGSLLVIGNIREHVEYDHLAFPGPGYQPVEFFDFIHRVQGEDLIWSLHLNPRHYTTPGNENQLRITVARLSPDGTREDIEVRRVRLPEKKMGVDAILFEPAINRIEAGASYEVSVQGLERRRRPYTLTYRVEFFEVGEQH